MSDHTEQTPSGSQSGMSLLHRLRCLWRGSAPWAVEPPTIADSAPIEKWPGGMRVLVADDNPVNLMLASEMLEHFGFQSVLAADGAQAVAIAANNRLDLILMDLQMPVLDGLGATRQIRRFERDQVRSRVPVVAYTSLTGVCGLFVDHGIDDVLEKPCDMPALRDCLLRWCPPNRRLVGHNLPHEWPRH